MFEMSLTVPDHVPQELVVDIDLFDVPGGDKDTALAWRSYQREGRHIVYSPRNGGYWIAVCGEDLPNLYRDFEHLSNAKVVIPDPGNFMLPTQADPPQHRGYRSVIDPFFTKEAIDAREAEIRALTIELIEGFRKRGHCEFISEFSLRLPLMIFLKMVGLPWDDLKYLRDLVETFQTNPDVAKKLAAVTELEDYLKAALVDRLENPRDDGLTKVAHSMVGERKITLEEALAISVMFLQGGLDTVANHMGFVVHYLAQHPETRRTIRENPQDLPAIVNEFLRRFPVANMARVVPEDWEYKGVLLKKGDRVLLPVSLYNLDPARLENPEAVDFKRETKHITFGSGRHTCAGAILARKEMTVFFEEWLSRIPEFELDLDNPPRLIAQQGNSIHSLHIRWAVND
jgi:cytochrome P450